MEQYIRELDSFLRKNITGEPEEELEDLMHSAVSQMKADGMGVEAITVILELMERHPLVRFGSPGSLTHFMESFYRKGYEGLLEESVKKSPTIHTLWLLNRLINGAEHKQAEDYLQIMQSIHTNTALADEIRSCAKDFLEYHKAL